MKTFEIIQRIANLDRNIREFDEQLAETRHIISEIDNRIKERQKIYPKINLDSKSNHVLE